MYVSNLRSHLRPLPIALDSHLDLISLLSSLQLQEHPVPSWSCQKTPWILEQFLLRYPWSSLTMLEYLPHSVDGHTVPRGSSHAVQSAQPSRCSSCLCGKRQFQLLQLFSKPPSRGTLAREPEVSCRSQPSLLESPKGSDKCISLGSSQ